jgi:hypothetical protein
MAVLFKLENDGPTLTLNRHHAHVQTKPTVAMMDPALVPAIGQKISIEGQPTFQVMDVQRSLGQRHAAVVILRALRPME